MITILPIGLPDDVMLTNLGIMQHEMEDVSKWAGITLEELINVGKEAKLKDLYRSKVLLQLLSIKKGIPYEEVIGCIIKYASKNSIEKVIKDIKQALIK